MPPKGAITEFTSWHKTTKCPFVIYADLEAFNVKTEDCEISPDDDVEVQVVHHCHLTGKIIGVAHSKCNLIVTAGSFVSICYQR